MIQGKVQFLVLCLNRHKYMKSNVQVNDLASDTSNNRSFMVTRRKMEDILTYVDSGIYVPLGIGGSSLLIPLIFLSEIEIKLNC